MRKNIKALLVTGMILLPLTACKTTMEAEEEASYPAVYALEKNHSYTLTNYDFLSISASNFQNRDGKIFKFSITENSYVVENIGTKISYKESYIWYFSKNASWYIISYYDKDTQVIIK